MNTNESYFTEDIIWHHVLLHDVIISAKKLIFFFVLNSEAAKNAKLLREFQLIPRLLLTLRDTSLSQPTVAAICNVLSLLLQGFPNPYDLLR